jgi:hypothetical protein
MSGQSLALYQQLIPALTMPGKRRKWREEDVAYTLINRLHDDVAIFDCRALPTAFVDDTGDAAFEEIQQTKDDIHLPFPQCYFEFANEPKMVYASESAQYIAALSDEFEKNLETADEDPTLTYYGYEIEIYDLSINVQFSGVTGAFVFGTPVPMVDTSNEPRPETPFFDMVNPRPVDSKKHFEKAGKRALAIATLMSEQLVLDKVAPDPTPKVTRERARLQKPPVSGEMHVLTVNVPIIRYRVRRSTPQGDTHESPALHWRRGHWRVYHRGSNFEQTGWVQRCLVGDPAKGYCRNTQYRLVHRPVPFRIINGGRI